jgi:colicin import membrane protein
MKRMMGTFIAGVSLLLAGGCERQVKEDQTKAEQAQQEANENTARAEREAAEKRAQAQREADEKAAKANAEARKESAEGQTKANETIREMQQDLVKARYDFQSYTQQTVNDLDHKIDKMRTDAQKASAKAQVAFEAAMKDVAAKRAALDTDLRSIGTQSAQSLDSFKAKVDKELDDLRKSIDAANDKL